MKKKKFVTCCLIISACITGVVVFADAKTDAESYLKEAKEQFSLGGDAMQDVNKAIQLDPQLSGAYSFRGFLEMMSNEYQKAEQDFNKAIELNPKNPLFYLGLAANENSQGNYLKTIKYCNEGIKAAGGTFDLFTTKAQAMEKLGNIDGAIQALTEAVKLPQNSQTGAAYYTMAKLEYSKNNLKSAAKDYIKASESYMLESENNNNNKKIYIKLANEARLKAVAIQKEISQKKQK